MSTEQLSEEKPAPKLWSRTAEEKLRKEFFKLQREECKDALQAYAKCAKEEGFLVILRCRDKLEEANQCLHKLTTDERYLEFKKKKIDAWVEQGVLVRPEARVQKS